MLKRYFKKIKRHVERQEGEGLSLSCYKPKVGDDEQSRGFNRSVKEGMEPMEIDQLEAAGGMDGFQLVGASDLQLAQRMVFWSRQH